MMEIDTVFVYLKMIGKVDKNKFERVKKVSDMSGLSKSHSTGEVVSNESRNK
mgnify:CR=1 FL=1